MNTEIDRLIIKIGGLHDACKLLGWQGGTIHQVRQEIKTRLSQKGIGQDKQGNFVELKIR